MAKDLHVVMLPWSAFGHLIPFFQLSIAMAKAGVKVSFVSTPRNIQRLPKPPPNLANLINLVDLPLPTLDGELLPSGAEATVDIPFEKIQYLKIAYDQLQLPFKQFIANEKPDWIFIDGLPHWAPEIAREFQIQILNFSVFPASTCVFFGNAECLVGDVQRRMRASPESLTSPPAWVDFPSTLAYRNFEAAGVYKGFFTENASKISDAKRVANVLNASQVIAIRSCTEFEGEYLNLFEKLCGKPVIPVGLLPPETIQGSQITDSSWRDIFTWLDEQKARSVVFVGFGSECKLSKDQVYEIAYGLELSKLPFLWGLRRPTWAINEVDALPIGFHDRTSKQGRVDMGWAPQIEILGHPSIGGSLFHAGWGSVIETLQFGHSLVVLPLIIDQPLTARVLVENGLAVEVERNEDGSFSRNGIAHALRLAMVSMEGKKLRDRAKEAAATFGDQKLHQDYYIGRFVEYLKSGATK